MRIVQLTEQEAANSAVMENVARYLLDGEPTHVIKPRSGAELTQALVSGTINAPALAGLTPTLPANIAAQRAQIGVDAPDVGVEQPEVPLASPFAAIGFGTAQPGQGTAVLSPATAPAASVPSPQVERRAVVPPPTVNAPVATTLQHAGLDLDASGLFWDERIHSSSREKNKDGTWRIKRGVDKSIVPGVEAEIRAVLAIPGPSAVPTPPTVPTVAKVPVVPTVPTIPMPPTDASGWIAPVPPAPAEPEPEGQALMRWMEALTPDMQPGGRFTPELMTKLLVAMELPPEAGMMAFVKRGDLVPAAQAKLNEWMVDPTKVPQ